MPSASQSISIQSSGQIAPNSVESSDIKDGEIVNADIAATAAIADSKLAQITTAGQVSGAALTSLANIPAGAGVIPAANVAVPTAYALLWQPELYSYNPADGATAILMCSGTELPESGLSKNLAYNRIRVPKAGSIKAAAIWIGVDGTLGTTEQFTCSIRINDTTDVAITTTMQANLGQNSAVNESLNTAVAAGDYLAIKIVWPTWATNPLNVSVNAVVYIA